MCICIYNRMKRWTTISATTRLDDATTSPTPYPTPTPMPMPTSNPTPMPKPSLGDFSPKAAPFNGDMVDASSAAAADSGNEFCEHDEAAGFDHNSATPLQRAYEILRTATASFHCADGTGPAVRFPGDDLGVDVCFHSVPELCTEIPYIASNVATPGDDGAPEQVPRQPRANWIVLPFSRPTCEPSEMYVIRFLASGQREVMTECEGNLPTLEEARNNREQVFATMREELVWLTDL